MENKSRLHSIVGDIRFWIIAFFILRLYGITNPPLEGASTWRQTDVLMIARNFYEGDSNIMYPRVDVAGELTGIVGCEFPFYNYLIFLTSLIFGFQNWYGRLINLILTSLGTLFFYKTLKRYFGEPVAFKSAITLLVSMWFSYSRITIPDVFAASLCLISLYFALQYFEEGKVMNLTFFLVLGLFGCLSKISAAIILTPLAIPLFSKRILLSRKIILSIASSVILTGVCWWYFIWVPQLNATYEFGSHFTMGFPISESIEDLITHWPQALNQFLVKPLKYTGLAVFLMALYLIIVNRRWIELVSFALPLVAYLVFIVNMSWGFYINDYYPLVAIPMFAFVVGVGLSKIKSERVALILLFIIGVEGISNQIHTFRIRQPHASLIPLEAALDTVSEPTDLIAINTDYHNPTPMFCAHRRGWNIPNNDLPYRIDMLKNRGCKVIVVLKIIESETTLSLPKVYDSKEFSIYKL